MVSNRFPREVAGMVLLVSSVMFASACSSDGASVLAPTVSRHANSQPLTQKGGKRPAAAPVPAFVFTSDAGAGDQLYSWSAGTVTQLTFTEQSNTRAHSSAGKLVFTSYRDGDAEIYIGDAMLSAVRRVTTSVGLDDEAALDPSGSTIAYVSANTGTLRIRIADTLGAWSELVTGAAPSVPERAPSWSPDGQRIAFTSNRDGSSQIYIVPATGGAAVRVTHESVGAFNPTWTSDGSAIVYVASAGGAKLRRVNLATGATTDVPNGNGVGDPDCNASGCLATVNPATTVGDIVWVPADGSPVVPVVTGAGNDFHPSIRKP